MIDKKLIVEELRKQDAVLNEIFKRREELSELAKNEKCYDEIWEKLFSDGESHYSF